MTQVKIKQGFLYCFAYILLGVNNLMIKVIPFKHLLNMFTNVEGFKEYDLSEGQRYRAKIVRAVIYNAARKTPWRSKCFEQALTALFLLRMSRIPNTIYFGIKRSKSGKIEAHAWTKTSNFIVSGEDSHEQFTPVLIRSRQ